MLTIEHLAELHRKHEAAARSRVHEFSLDGRHFAFNTSPAVMGVINLSPDSWYRESVCLNTQSAVRRGQLLAAQGADLVDIGAESTLARAARVDDAVQRDRILPVLQGLRQQRILVSVETYQHEVARACVEAGAQVLNLTGQKLDIDLCRMVSDHGAGIILCYVQGPNVRDVGEFLLQDDPAAVMYEYFARQVETATKNGVEKLILDPGLGFYYRNLQDGAQRVTYQMAAFLNTFRLRALGFPVCQALPHAFEYFREEVRSAEAFFAVLAALGKTDLFRTHEVPRVKAVLDTLRAFAEKPA